MNQTGSRTVLSKMRSATWRASLLSDADLSSQKGNLDFAESFRVYEFLPSMASASLVAEPFDLADAILTFLERNKNV